MHSYEEAAVALPDIRNPATTKRPLCLSDGSGGVLVLEPLELMILVNACLYVVYADGQGLRAGDILSRNLNLTRRRGQDPDNLAEQVFIRYGSVFDARRGIGRIQGRYRSVELPELARWRMDADWLLRTSWTLHRATQEQEAEFVWRADRRIVRHASDVNESKAAARGVFEKVRELKDSRGRRNFPSFPLQLSSADRRLEWRAQEVRGIGRKMDWRAVVLEHLIDQLEHECRMIRRAAQEALNANDIFGPTRTPKTLRMRALRMHEYGAFLREVRVRTFSRAFTHVADELDEVSDLLHAAAEGRDPEPIKRVPRLLRKIYRSMALAEVHWRLQEILLVASDHAHRRVPFSPEQIRLFLGELEDVLRHLTEADSLTGELLGEGFVTDIPLVVSGNIRLARISLLDTGGVNLRAFKEYLDRACAPL